VELAAPDVHRALAYLVAVNDAGYRPTNGDFEEYAGSPDRYPGKRETAFSHVISASVLKFLQTVEVRPAETYVDHCSRLGWLTVGKDERLSSTQLGRAVLRGLETQTAEAQPAGDIVIEAHDSLAFARVVQRIAEAGPALLVDPYFRLEELLTIVTSTSVTRVLTSERTTAEQRTGLKLGVESLQIDRPFEVRVATREVHDRYLIADEGEVQFVGTSLNSLGRTSTAMGKVHDGAVQLRELYEKVWRESSPLASAGRTAEPREEAG
jgi:hypothetical protein